MAAISALLLVISLNEIASEDTLAPHDVRSAGHAHVYAHVTEVPNAAEEPVLAQPAEHAHAGRNMRPRVGPVGS